MTSPKPKPRSRFRPLHWFLIVGAAGLLVMTFKVAGIFFVSDEARDLQIAFADATHADADAHIQISVGPGLMSVARLVPMFIDDMPAEARHAIAALQEASVGIYRLEHNHAKSDRAALMAAADHRLGSRGWSRIVTVADGRDTVLIYTPADWQDPDEVEVCVAVSDGSELVVVSAKAKTAPLLEIMKQHLPDRRAI